MDNVRSWKCLSRFVEMRLSTKINEVKRAKVVFISKTLNQEMIENVIAN